LIIDKFIEELRMLEIDNNVTLPKPYIEQGALSILNVNSYYIVYCYWFILFIAFGLYLCSTKYTQ
jgi:hypothetical protein